MKNISLIIIFGLLLFCFSNCNKPNEDTPSTFECINSSFTDTLSIEIVPAYIEEDSKGNIIILGNNNDIIKVVKLNPEGELKWVKEYPQLEGKEQGLVFINENFFLIKTSTDHYEYELSSLQYNNIWIKNGNMLIDDNNYISTYELTSIVQPKLQLENTNTSFLTQINLDGEIMWSKEFKGDVCSGESLYRIDENSFLFLTSEFNGPYFELISYNGHIDTIDRPDDRNKSTVHKINDKGDVIWSTEIDNIFNVNWANNYPTSYLSSARTITQNGNNIVLNTLHKTYELSLDGNITDSYQPNYNFQGNWTFSMAVADNTANFFSGELHTYDNYTVKNYIMKYDFELNETAWEIEKNNRVLYISSYTDKGLLTIRHVDTFNKDLILEKISINGESLWQKEIENKTWSGGITMTATCNGGSIIAIAGELASTLTIIKTDENGDY